LRLLWSLRVNGLALQLQEALGRAPHAGDLCLDPHQAGRKASKKLATWAR
jgi:hypothetical protein